MDPDEKLDEISNRPLEKMDHISRNQQFDHHGVLVDHQYFT
jgi:hypothetical protein